MRLLISDTNILIDMEEGKLLESMFKLGHRFATPDILFELELREHHVHLLALGLERLSLDEKAMRRTEQLRARYIRTSANDCMALALSEQKNCPLLTGDRALREAAKNECLDVYGTIWVVNQMVKHSVIDADEARCAYSRMQEKGRRLPWQAALSALERWEVQHSVTHRSAPQT